MTTLTGLSPRGRGKPVVMIGWTPHPRSIPAWAGETRRTFWSRSTEWVYPRVGGGNRYPGAGRRAQQGLSPRGRGKPAAVVLNCTDRGSIPAWAGETTSPAAVEGAVRVYPRVGGGN